MFEIGYGYWAFAIIFIVVILFAIPEYIAIRQKKGGTLSEFMAYMARGTKFGPIWCFLWGALIGGLLVHFSGWCIGPCL